MNTELKALLTLVFDGLTLGEKILAKVAFFSLISDMFQFAEDAPAAVASWSDLQAELAALSGSAEEADLIAFVEQKFGTQFGSVKAQAILAAALKLIQDIAQDGLALQSAINS